jgi:hypothetical protein
VQPPLLLLEFGQQTPEEQGYQTHTNDIAKREQMAVVFQTKFTCQFVASPPQRFSPRSATDYSIDKSILLITRVNLRMPRCRVDIIITTIVSINAS